MRRASPPPHNNDFWRIIWADGAPSLWIGYRQSPITPSTRRLRDCSRCGFPWSVVCSRSALSCFPNFPPHCPGKRSAALWEDRCRASHDHETPRYYPCSVPGVGQNRIPLASDPIFHCQKFAADFNLHMRQTMERILRGPVGDRAWQQIGLPTRFGGAGLFSAADTSYTAFLAASISLESSLRGFCH